MSNKTTYNVYQDKKRIQSCISRRDVYMLLGQYLRPAARDTAATALRQHGYVRIDVYASAIEILARKGDQHDAPLA